MRLLHETHTHTHKTFAMPTDQPDDRSLAGLGPFLALCGERIVKFLYHYLINARLTCARNITLTRSKSLTCTCHSVGTDNGNQWHDHGIPNFRFLRTSPP